MKYQVLMTDTAGRDVDNIYDYIAGQPQFVKYKGHRKGINFDVPADSGSSNARTPNECFVLDRTLFFLFLVFIS